ncbi:hypothetical protein [Streptomyces sp. NBC_00470]|uniref:hypothetical protein n=1 Tax=Streptomyces sp. NBC_00470 TaxID=2975753 RepID=UPI002F90A1BE
MPDHPSAGCRMQIMFDGTVRASYQPGNITLADGTAISFDPDRHTARILTDGWNVGDVVDTDHDRLTRCIDAQGYEHWRRADGQIFHDDQVDPDRVVLVHPAIRCPMPRTARLLDLLRRARGRCRRLLRRVRRVGRNRAHVHHGADHPAGVRRG